MNYPCVKCGLCCNNVKSIIEQVGHYEEGHPLHFPYEILDNGSCSMLKDNLCQTYNTRPLLCNVNKFAKHFGYELKDLYKINSLMCNIMLESNGHEERVIIK